MKKTYLLTGLLFLIAINTVMAENVLREPIYSSHEDLLLYNYPYWIGTNTTGTIYVTNVPSGSYAEMNLTGSNATNMTHISSTDIFRSYVTSASEEDVNFTVIIKNSSGTPLANMTDTLRFRIPFTVELLFFKNSNSSGTEVEAYDNEFQYATFYYKASGSGYSYELEPDTSYSWLNNIGRLFPYYKDIGGDSVRIRRTQEIYLSGKLNSGVAEITTYQNGTYILHTVDTKIYGGFTPLYEFGRPIANGDIEFNSVVANDINVAVENATSYSVFISAWEVYKWNLTKNVLKIVGVLLVWGFLVVSLSFLMTGWLPTDVRPKAFSVVLGTLAICTSPIAIVAVRILW